MNVFLLVEDGIPRAYAVFFSLDCLIGGVDEFNGLDGVSLTYGVDDVLPGEDTTKDSMHSVQVRCCTVGDEELRAVAIRHTGISHGEDAGTVMFERWVNFIFKRISGGSPPGARGISCLNHEVGNDAVEGNSVVVTSFGEVEEVCRCNGCFGGVDDEADVSLVRLENEPDVFTGSRLTLRENYLA